MAVTQDQLTIIHEALDALGVAHGADASTLASDVNGALGKLASLVGDGSASLGNLENGYTPEIGQTLLQKIDEFKASDNFSALKAAHAVSENVAKALLRDSPQVPAAMKRDPQKLFDLLENADDIVKALDTAHAGGGLQPAPEIIPPGPKPDDGDAAVEDERKPAPVVQPEEEPVQEDEAPEAEEVARTVEGETFIVEFALSKIVPMLNEQLAKSPIPLGQSIPEVGEIGGKFDVQSQAALQGLLSVLGHPMAMNFESDEPWRYSPETGKYILDNLDQLKEKLGIVMSQSELAELEQYLNPEMVGKFVESLNFLHEKGEIKDEALVGPDANDRLFPVEAPLYVQGLYEGLVEKYAETNPEMLELASAMTQLYTGYDNVSALINFEGIEDTDTEEGLKDRVQVLYAEARKQHGGSDEDFNSEFIIIMNTVIAMPYGSDDYRTAFKDVMKNSMQAATDADDAVSAAAAFANVFMEGRDKISQEHSFPEHVNFMDRTSPVWKPDLHDFEIQTENGPATALQIAEAYDTYNFSFLPLDEQAEGLSRDIVFQSYISFKENGQQYVAAIDKKSMVFSIEKIDVEKLERMRSEGASHDEMRVADAGYALLNPPDGSRQNFNDLMRDLKHSAFDRSFSEFSAEYENKVELAREYIEAEKAAQETSNKPSPESASQSFNNKSPLPENTPEPEGLGKEFDGAVNNADTQPESEHEPLVLPLKPPVP